MRLYSKALVEENGKYVKAAQSPEALNWFFRLAVSPEPKQDREMWSARMASCRSARV